ncbi:MAG TPA: DoxX family membrane protein [Ktedonobacterales bacterium]|nr:DoxX family membrane protein [Ktedonobacterales bacterium]
MPATVSVGLLVLRLVGGLTLAAHGAQKGLGWFGGAGFAKFSRGFQGQGLRPGWFWTGLVVLGELGGGLSLAFGLLTPLGAAGAFGAMFMAIARSHWKNGFWNGKRGIEFPLALLAIGAGLGLAGPGSYSLDALLGITLPYPLLFLVLALAALVVDLVGLRLGRPVAPAASAAAPAPAAPPADAAPSGS